MAVGSSRLARQVAGFLHDVGASGVDPECFARVGVAELPRLVASDLTTLSVCNLETGHRCVVGNPDAALSAEDIAAFDRHFFEHPLVRFHTTHTGGGAHRISDSLPDARFRRTAVYADYYRRIGLNRAVAVPLHVDDRTLVSFVLNRAGRDFRNEEIDLLDRMRAWLGAMYRNAVAVRRAAEAIAQMQSIAVAADWAVVTIDASRRIRELSAAAAAMLATTFPGYRAQPGRPLPESVDAWLRGADDTDSPRTSLDPWMRSEPHATLTVRALPELGHDVAWLLLARDERPPGAAQAVRLTAREREVLDWVAAGKTNRQIASILGLSTRTVQKHLENAYVKLGVENRTAAVMRVERSTRRPRR